MELSLPEFHQTAKVLSMSSSVDDVLDFLINAQENSERRDGLRVVEDVVPLFPYIEDCGLSC